MWTARRTQSAGTEHGGAVPSAGRGRGTVCAHRSVVSIVGGSAIDSSFREGALRWHTAGFMTLAAREVEYFSDMPAACALHGSVAHVMCGFMMSFVAVAIVSRYPFTSVTVLAFGVVV